ncbi:MAG TPA: hypothetical protein VFQ25_02835 [Ktedonobacterales bacterium]|nr:hypothetical protein [Ktedonobacterales bacterium]
MSRYRPRRGLLRRRAPLVDWAPLYGRNPLGYPPWLPRGWTMRPIWRTKAARRWLAFLLLAPLAVLALAVLGALLATLLGALTR